MAAARAQLAARSRASTAGTGSTAARPTSSCRRSTTTTTPCAPPATSPTATTSPRTSPTAPSSSSADLRAVDVDQPFFLYFVPGACHSPHHAPPEWIERYRGRFDAGWDEWREATLARQQARGLLPAGHRALAPAAVGAGLGRPRPERPARWPPGSWSASPGSSRTPTPRSVGSSSSSSETGDLDDTLVVVVLRQRRQRRGRAARVDQRRPAGQRRPGPAAESCAGGSTSSADRRPTTTTRGAGPWPGNTPFRRWKREVHEGGVADPCIVRLADPATGGGAGASAASSSTPSTCSRPCSSSLGVEAPTDLGDVAQPPLDGTSFAYLLGRDGGGSRSATRRSTSRCSGAARSTTRAGRPSRSSRSGPSTTTGSTRRPVRRRRVGAVPRRRRPVGVHDLAAREPDRLAAHGRAVVGRRPSATRCSRSTTGRSTRS